MSVGKWDIILKYIQAHTHLPMRFTPPWTIPTQPVFRHIYGVALPTMNTRYYNVSYSKYHNSHTTI